MELLLEIIKAASHYDCYACGKHDDVAGIYIRREFENNGVIIRLCADCRKKLQTELLKYKRKGLSE